MSSQSPSPSHPTTASPQPQTPIPRARGSITPRIIIHGGAGSISPTNLPPSSYILYRTFLLSLLHQTHALLSSGTPALDAATHAVAQLENEPLFNCGKGAVFTRAGTNELEASVMVSRGWRKRGVGVSLLGRVRNPVLLAREVLLRGGVEDGEGENGEGEDDEGEDEGLGAENDGMEVSKRAREGGDGGGDDDDDDDDDDSDPSGETGEGTAQGHVQLSGATAEDLARRWGLEMVEPNYFYTRKRWEEHVRGLEREKKKEKKRGKNSGSKTTTTTTVMPEGGGRTTPTHLSSSGVNGSDDDDPSWDGKEYLPQGTVGCVCLDKDGVLCVATSTGGLTNKLPGRLGDTPTFGAGFWAEEWMDSDNEGALSMNAPSQISPAWGVDLLRQAQLPAIGFLTLSLSLGALLPEGLRRGLEECLPGSFRSGGRIALPLDEDINSKKQDPLMRHSETRIASLSVQGPVISVPNSTSKSTRHSIALSGTGNGDSFLKLCAARTAGAIVRFSPTPGSSSSITSSSSGPTLSQAVTRIAGPGGDLQTSAGSRWGKTGEGEGGMIGIEMRDGKGEIVFDFNCGGMFRAWVDDEGVERMMVFKKDYEKYL
ncbi:hypothetical protein MMC25_003363 [Agyrium rufum]|nr:hypothetical protein [Agyrium rufum]